MQFSQRSYEIKQYYPPNNNNCCCSVTKSYLTLCDPRDYSPLVSTMHGISQARILEWIAISFSRRSSQDRNWTHNSCIGRWIIQPWASWEILFPLSKRKAWDFERSCNSSILTQMESNALFRESDFKASVKPYGLLPPSTLLLHFSPWPPVQSILWSEVNESMLRICRNI